MEGISKVGKMRELLQTGSYAKKEMAELTGLKESTVGVQLGYHLKNQGFNVFKEKIEGVLKYRIESKPEKQIDEEAGVVPEDDIEEPSTQEIATEEASGDAQPASEKELDALLDE